MINKKQMKNKPPVDSKQITMPTKDIKVESGQPTFLKALTKIIKKHNKS